MNIFLNEYFGFCFGLNFELNHFSARFNEKMNFQNVSPRANNKSHLSKGRYHALDYRDAGVLDNSGKNNRMVYCHCEPQSR